MKPHLFPSLLLLASVGTTHGFVPARTIDEVAEAFVQHAEEVLSDGGPVYFMTMPGNPLLLSYDEIRNWKNRKVLLMIPKTESAFDVRVRIFPGEFGTQTKSVFIRGRSEGDLNVWFTQKFSVPLQQDDYSLSLRIGFFDSRGEGQVSTGGRLVNWKQNNEYRLVSLSAPSDPSDPHFSLVLEDELLVNVATETQPGKYIPTIRPTIDFRPANLGVSVSGGKKTRYKLSVGAGYMFSTLPLYGPDVIPGGYLRLQLNFR